MHRGTMRCEHCSNHQMRRTPSEPSANQPPPPSARCPQGRELRPARQEVPATGGGNKAVTSQPRTGQSTSYGDVKSSYGGQAGGTGGGARQGHPGAPTDRGGSNTDTQNAGATPGGTRASTADKEEGRSKSGEATRTGNQNGGDGRACAWGAATTQGMAWTASPVATGCQGNPCSTGIRWGVSPAAQMGCLRNRRGSPSGVDQP